MTQVIESNNVCLKISQDEAIKAAMFKSAFLKFAGNSKNPAFCIMDNKNTKKILKHLKPRLAEYGIPLRLVGHMFTTGNSLLLVELSKIWYKGKNKIKHPVSVVKTSSTESYLDLIPDEKINAEERERISRTREVNNKRRFEDSIKKVSKNKSLINALKNDPVINGVLLGDGSITKRKKAYGNQNLDNHHCPFKVEQNWFRNYLPELKKYLEREYHDELVAIWPRFKIGFLKHSARSDARSKDIHHEMYLQTTTHPAFTILYNIWYSNRDKIVPPHIEHLDATTVAWWYMGDGGRGKHDDGKNIKKAQIELATHSFTADDVNRLILMLKELGIKANRNQRIVTLELIKALELDELEPYSEERKWMIKQIHEVRHRIKYKKGPQYTIKISTSEYVQKFIDLVKDHVVPAFSDKIQDVFVRSKDQFRIERIDATISRINNMQIDPEIKRLLIKGNDIRKKMIPEHDRRAYKAFKSTLENCVNSPEKKSPRRKKFLNLIQEQLLEQDDSYGDFVISLGLKNHLS